MPYTALYRKKRPQAFDRVIGQPHIVRTLKNQLMSDSISHAYLFCGTRGTGKTSTAKIFSRAVNCLSAHEGEPCNACENCLDILAERNMSVIEVDAASRSKVENMRDLLEDVIYPPAQGKYRVYIIDEVHMLSTNAFNALLKTLEEPPPYVIFILATTDPQKIPPTILSRCQRYDFRRITIADMTAAIRGYLGDDATVSDDAIHYIATLSDGAMRDALSILDQCLSFYGDETVTLDKARQLLGAVDRQVLFDFADALTACDISRVLTLINGIVKDGRDVSQFVSDFVRHLRDLLVASQTDGLDLLEYIDEVRQALAAQSKRLPLGVTIHYIYTFSELQRDLRFAPHTRTALEVCAVKLCKPQEACAAPVQEAAKPMQVQEAVKSVQVQEVVKPVQVQEAVKPVQEAVKPVQEAVKSVQEAVKPVEPQASPAAAKTPLTPDVLTDIQKGWSTFCKSDIFTMPEIIRLSQTGLEISNRQLQVICGDEINMKRLKSEQKKLSEGLMHAFSLDTAPNLAFVVRDAYNKPDTPQEAAAREEEADAWADLGAQVEIESEW